MHQIIYLLYGLFSYGLFLVTFLYSIGFVTNTLVPKAIDTGTSPDLIVALSVNTVLLSLFAIQHTVMARPSFKAWWVNYVPSPIERSTYVLLASLILLLLFWQWQPLTKQVWHVSNNLLSQFIWFINALGWMMVLVSTFLINHFDLFGLRQVYLYAKGDEYSQLNFKTPFLYQLVRHPIMLGFIIAFWVTPDMTQGHLFFALVTTAYIVIALQFEERDLLHFHGERYENYRKQVSMIIPRFKHKTKVFKH